MINSSILYLFHLIPLSPPIPKKIKPATALATLFPALRQLFFFAVVRQSLFDIQFHTSCKIFTFNTNIVAAT